MCGLQRELHAFSNALTSREPTASIRYQSRAGNNERLSAAEHRKEMPYRFHSVRDYGHGDLESELEQYRSRETNVLSEGQCPRLDIRFDVTTFEVVSSIKLLFSNIGQAQNVFFSCYI